MEKPRMDRRFPGIRPGLLSLPGLFFCLLFQIFGQTDETTQPDPDSEPVIEPLKIEISTSPKVPILNSLWVVSILVDYPSPAQVIIRHPPLPAALSLDSIRTGSRMIQTDEEEMRRWTAVEFCFIPQRPGAITLKPFEIITPQDHRFTEAISVSIPGVIREYRPYFSWGTLPKSLTIGEQQELSLRLINWDPRKPLPGNDLFRQDVPEGMILEEQQLVATDRDQGIIFRLAVIPLQGSHFTLKPIRFQHEGLALEIPGINIPVVSTNVSEACRADTAVDSNPLPLFAEDNSPLTPPFPEISVEIFPLLKKDYEKVLQQVRELWNQGQIPEALAEMRRNERDHLAGLYFVPLRQEAERSLNINPTQDEKWRPRKFFLALFGLSIGLLSLIVVVYIRPYQYISKKNTVTSSFSHGYKVITITVILLIAASISFWEGILNHTQNRETSSAVLRTATAYRIPGGSGVSAYFSEGQPVIIRSVSDDWVYVESFDGRIGWVSRGNIIVY